ncbi:hypothetical protein LP420_25255 [Massilia sp. B-10]|nr:hypothetical protein LP420_25255 [Massilia sp. B-10]
MAVQGLLKLRAGGVLGCRQRRRQCRGSDGETATKLAASLLTAYRLSDGALLLNETFSARVSQVALSGDGSLLLAVSGDTVKLYSYTGSAYTCVGQQSFTGASCGSCADLAQRLQRRRRLHDLPRHRRHPGDRTSGVARDRQPGAVRERHLAHHDRGAAGGDGGHRQLLGRGAA